MKSNVAILKQGSKSLKTALCSLEASETGASESLPFIFSAWMSLAKAIEPRDEACFSVQSAAFIINRSETGGALKKIKISASKEFNKIVSKFEKYKNNDLESCSAREITVSIDLCHEALALVRQYYFDGLPWWKKTFKFVKALFIILILTASAIVLIYSTVIYLSRPGENDGISAVYYSKPLFTGHPFEKLEHFLSVDWKRGDMPLNGLPSNFSFKWQGCINIPDDLLSRRFIVETSSTLKVILDDKVILNAIVPKKIIKKAIKREAVKNKNNKAKLIKSFISERFFKTGIHKLEVTMQKPVLPVNFTIGFRGENDKLLPIKSKLLAPSYGKANFKCGWKDPGGLK